MANKLDIVISATDRATLPIRNVNKQLDEFQNKTKRATRDSNQFGVVASKTTRSISRFGKNGLQQVGFQLQDFFVQVGGGTSALQAFGQQGSQLFGIFGAGGALFGALIAIVSAVGGVYLKTRDVVKSFSDELEELNTASVDYSRFNKSSIEVTKELTKEFGKADTATRALFKSQAMLAKFKLSEALNQSQIALKNQFPLLVNINNLQEKYNKLTDKQKNAVIELRSQETRGASALRRLTEIKVKAQTDYNVEIDSFLAKMNAVNNLDAFKEPADAAEAVLAVYKELTAVGLSEMDVKSRSTAEGLLSLANILSKLAADTDAATGKVRTLFGILEADGLSLSQGIADSFGTAFMSMIDGTKSVKEAFKSMAAAIIKQLLQVLVIQQIVGRVGTGGENSGGTGLAGMISNTRANGGSVTSNQPYLIGERGAELFVPHTAGRIVPNKDIMGSSGGGVTINQTIQVSTGVQQTVRNEIQSLMPQIASASKQAVLDARRRGGSFAAAF